MNTSFLLLLAIVTQADQAPAPAATPEKVAEAATPAAEQPSVFELPFIQGRYVALQQSIAQLSAEEKYPQAEELARQATELVPHDPLAHYNLACALAGQKKIPEALDALAKAVDLGFNQTQFMQADHDLVSLQDQEQFKELVEKSRTAKVDPSRGWQYSPVPAPIEDGVANVTEKNTAWDGRLGILRSLFEFDKTTNAPAVIGLGEAGELVQKWYAEGTAAGNLGDLYDNHDSDHSNMNYQAFPQLARIEFSDEAKKRNLHHGLQTAFFYNAPTIGNSSTALTNGPFWRCQGRIALTQPNGPARLAMQYFANHIYFYPEHRDYDPGHNGQGDGYGDVLPANVPYIVLSQGSSGSDRPFMQAFMLTWAAFRPEVKQKLKSLGALAPITQMIFRRSNKQVEQPEDYFTGKAHPPVFDGSQIDALKMVQLAHEMTVDELPPIAQLQVVDESEALVGVDYFDVGPREKFFDTPCAIGRIVKRLRGPYIMTVSAQGSKDLNGKPIQYRWELLRGDPEKVLFMPVPGQEGATKIYVSRHPRQPIAEGSQMESSRVDVALFVSNDKYPSPPAIISFQFLENQKFTYNENKTENGVNNGELLSVDYMDPQVSKNYVDPLLDFKKNWRDEYKYNELQQCIGWTRVRADDDREEFTFDGCLVTAKDELGRPTEARVVKYVPLTVKPNEPPQLEQMATKEVAKYRYISPDDKHGRREE